MPARPKDKKELQKREAIGVIRASRFVRRYAHSHKPINIQTINRIHAEIFKDAWPEIAGEYRTENVEITHSKHLPPHYSRISEQMSRFGAELEKSLEDCELVEGFILDINNESKERLDAIGKILNLAARVHHMITWIHPYREGNGRTARLAGNLVLERYGIVGLSIKIELADKERYRKCLAQADKEDYNPLLDLIVEGIVDRYKGVSMKFYK